MNSKLKSALLKIEGLTFRNSEHLSDTIKQLSDEYPTLTSKEWLEVLEQIRGCLAIGFKKKIEYKTED